MINYVAPQIRRMMIDQIQSNENQQRKAESLKQYEVFQDRIEPYVKKYLSSMYSKSTVDEMSIIASVNLAKRIILQESSLYTRCPERHFVGLSEEQTKVVEQVYKDMMADIKLLKANIYYRLQMQHHLQIVPLKGKLKIKTLLNHHIDVVPNPDSPEYADAYIVNGFDRSMYAPRLSESEDGQDQMIADSDDYKATLNRLAVWSDEFNYIMDKSGNIVSGSDVANPIGIKPFIDVHSDKDFEYFVRSGQSVTDFTVQYNAALSDLGHIVRMQGFAQAWFKGAEDMIPQNLQIGPNLVLKLPVNPNNPVETDFGFATPNPDLQGSIQYIEMLLSNFLSSRGADPKMVSGKAESTQYSSGLERLLAMIDQFEASRTDIAVFERVERELFEIVKVYLNTYAGTEILEYNIAPISADATVMIKYAGPESVSTDIEKLDIIERKLQLGLISDVEAIMYDREVDREKAEEIIEKIVEDSLEVKLIKQDLNKEEAKDANEQDSEQEMQVNG